MLQSFSENSDYTCDAKRIDKLRETFIAHNIDGVLVPRADEYQGEYVPAAAERLAWITGFTGSAGCALITKDKAHVFVDGRYTSQLSKQTDPNIITSEDLVENPPAKWLENSNKIGFRLGVYSYGHTVNDIKNLKTALEKIDGELVLLSENLVDKIWHDRPKPHLAKINIQPIENTGKLASDKIDDLQASVRDHKASAYFMSDPSSIAWTFNIRGNDVPHTPHPLARAYFPVKGKPLIFIEEAKLSIETKAYLTQLATIVEPNRLAEEIQKLTLGNFPALIDPAHCPFAIANIFETHGFSLKFLRDLTLIKRACKNSAEIDGSRAAHIRDGVALVEFLAWLDEQPAGTISEIDAAQKLENYRAEYGKQTGQPLLDLSFDTISGAGSNGAIIHYRVNEDSNRILSEGELYLCDSGGQYRDGTTDITRTMPVGKPNADQIQKYTLVLKGLIAVSLARFPNGTRGMDIDPLARAALWQAGCDYAHGTGHGVGSYLSVHEGPQSISKRGAEPLLPGMIISNEPGYYRDGDFGIRLENLIVVKEPEKVPGGDQKMMRFETLTFCPFDKRMIDKKLLKPEEIDWLDNYHKQTFDKLMQGCKSEKTQKWLNQATSPL